MHVGVLRGGGGGGGVRGAQWGFSELSCMVEGCMFGGGQGGG